MSEAKEPALRPFRTLAWGLYLALCIAFAVAIILSVVKSVIAMTPQRLPAATPLLSVRECADGADRLWKELEAGRRAMTERPARGADLDWSAFRVAWMTKLRQLESRCGLRTKGRGQLRAAFNRLEHVQDLYTTHAVQFAREMGSEVDGLQSALTQAKR